MSVDLGELFGLDVSALELIVRTTAVYLSLLAILRVLARREMGNFELPDLLLVVLVADGVQNGMAGEYTTVTGALIIAGTLFGWNYLLDYLTFRFAFARRLLQPKPLVLIEDGQFNRRNMRRELISREELMAELRLQEIDDVNQVQLACFERNGNLSIRRREEENGASTQAGSGSGARGAR